MVWKNGKTGFHAMELFPKLASMLWKMGESGFHGVEKQGGLKRAAACPAGGADNGDKSGFHGVKLFRGWRETTTPPALDIKPKR